MSCPVIMEEIAVRFVCASTFSEVRLFPRRCAVDEIFAFACVLRSWIRVEKSLFAVRKEFFDEG